MVTLIGLFVPNVKNISYEYEHEIRLIVYEMAPKFRSMENLILPYTTIEIPIEALTAITLGSKYDERTIQSIKMMLWSRGLEDLCDKISISKIPYRS